MFIARAANDVNHVYCYIPVVSTVTSLVDLVFKCAVLPNLKKETIAASRYYSALETKSIARCIILLIPVIGNLIVAVYDSYHSKEQILKHPENFNLKDLPDELRDDEDVVLAILNSQYDEVSRRFNGSRGFAYVSQRIRSSRELLHDLIAKDPSLFKHIAPELKTDEHFIQLALEKDPYTIDFMDPDTTPDYLKHLKYVVSRMPDKYIRQFGGAIAVSLLRDRASYNEHFPGSREIIDKFKQALLDEAIGHLKWSQVL